MEAYCPIFHVEIEVSVSTALMSSGDDSRCPHLILLSLNTAMPIFSGKVATDMVQLKKISIILAEYLPTIITCSMVYTVLLLV